MGTLSITYDGTTKTYTQAGAPVVAYGGQTLLTASSWSGINVLTCAEKFMKTDIVVGATMLKTAGKFAKSNIRLKYTYDEARYQTIKTSGTFTIPSGYNRAQFFAVGGGGGGFTSVHGSSDNSEYMEAGGSGGGYTATSDTLVVSSGNTFSVEIGAGGAVTTQGTVSVGGTTSVTDSSGTLVISAAGGSGPKNPGFYSAAEYNTAGDGGSGGGYKGCYSSNGALYGYNGGSDGSDGESPSSYSSSYIGNGQGSSTFFNGVIYAGGGGGGARAVSSSEFSAYVPGSGGDGGGGKGALLAYKSEDGNVTLLANIENTAGQANTGGGSGGQVHDYVNGYSLQGKAGGSGIVVVKLWAE